MGSMHVGRALCALAPFALWLAACGARTDLGVTDAGADSVMLADSTGDAGAPDAGDAGPPKEGPCYVCRSPLVQECTYCLIQGFDTTYVCPLPHSSPGPVCNSLLEDHVTPKGSHFTCFYCIE